MFGRNKGRKKRISRFSKHRFANPYKEKQRGKKRKKRRLFLYFFVILVIGGIIYFFVGPFFELKGYTIEGNTTIATAKLEQTVQTHLDTRWALLPQKKRYNLHTRKLHTRLMEDYPLESVDISVKNGVMSIRVQEEVTEIAWKTKNNWYLLDLNGVVLREAVEEEKMALGYMENGEEVPEEIITSLHKRIPIIIDNTNRGIFIEEDILDVFSRDYLLAFSREAKNLNIETRYYISEGTSPQWLKVISNKPYEILIDGNSSIEKQLEYIDTILKQGVDENNLISIDVRFGDHVYLKERETELIE